MSDIFPMFFPGLTEQEEAKLVINKEGLYSITKPYFAEQQLAIIKHKLTDFKLNNLVITDGTGCTGAETIYAAAYLKPKLINTLEINPENYKMLENNISVYRKHFPETKFALHNKSITSWRNKQDIVLLDPPWGGPSYKYSNIPVYLNFASSKLNSKKQSQTPLENVCNKLRAKWIFIKVPTNFDRKQIEPMRQKYDVEIHPIYKPISPPTDRTRFVPKSIQDRREIAYLYLSLHYELRRRT